MKKHYHFIGIGGIGMGALAALLLDKGFKVSGSDLAEGKMTKILRMRGAEIFLGHQPQNIKGAEYIIFSSAVNQENCEIAEARKRNIPIIRRAQLLADLMKDQTAITIAGAHGKTTTTSMIAQLLEHAGLSPTTAIGGLVNGTSRNAQLGKGTYFVAEVDESDGSFLYFSPQYSVVTNIDFEHIDYYHTWENIQKAYKEYLLKTDKKGLIFACGDDNRLNALLKDIDRPLLRYGFSSHNDIIAKNVRVASWGTKYDAWIKGKLWDTIELSIPGEHNVLNSLACVGLGSKLKLEKDVIKESLNAFTGVQRRFQVKTKEKDIWVVDDYAHHPTEIEATLKTAASLKRDRVVAVFQPHRYTRLKFLLKEFAQSLTLSQYIILTDIYAASEKPLPGVSIEGLVEEIKLRTKKPVHYIKKDKMVDFLKRITHAGDVVMMLGAGDITKIAEEFADTLKEQKSALKKVAV